MTVLDPTSALGKVRLFVGDWHDLVILPDAVITATLDDNNQSVARAAQRCAIYILATLTSKSHKKVGLLEIWGSETFDNYLAFLNKVVLNHALAGTCPIPYSPGADTQNPLVTVVQDWKAGYAPGAVVLPYLPNSAPIITNEPT